MRIIKIKEPRIEGGCEIGIILKYVLTFDSVLCRLCGDLLTVIASN